MFQALGVPANVHSDDGSEFKREFKELDEFLGHREAGDQGHAYFAERIIRTIKKAMLRRIAAGAGRRGQWHQRKEARYHRWRQTLPTLTPKWQRLLCATPGPSTR